MDKSPPSILRMAPRDNCGIAIRLLTAGEVLYFEGLSLTVRQDIPLGHKIALQAMNAGDKVLRYGALIGSVTVAVQPGEHIHLHNLRSDYLPTYTLDDAQRFVPSSDSPHKT